MPLIALGINHNTAPVEIREQLSFDTGELVPVLRELSDLHGVREVAVLSTCNRTEIYGSLDEDGGEMLMEWLRQRGFRDPETLNRVFYQFRDDEAVRHAMRVACGLDSMVLGEPQILGQMKQAYEAALEAGTIHRSLHQLFQGSFAVAKQVRTDTGIGQSPVSVAYAAVDLARQIFADFEHHSALLLGAGETIELVARHLTQRGIGQMIVANRNPERARELAARHAGYGIGLDEIASHLSEADIIIASTASRTPVLTREMVQASFRKRRHKPVLMVDIAVPRDIAADVADLADVFLYTIDDLQQTIRENMASREQAAASALEIVDARARELAGNLSAMDAVPAIRRLRTEAFAQRDHSLDQARRMIEAGRSPEEVAEHLAHTLTNRLIHKPTVYLREAGARGDREALDRVRALFGLDQSERDEE